MEVDSAAFAVLLAPTEVEGMAVREPDSPHTLPEAAALPEEAHRSLGLDLNFHDFEELYTPPAVVAIAPPTEEPKVEEEGDRGPLLHSFSNDIDAVVRGLLVPLAKLERVCVGDESTDQGAPAESPGDPDDILLGPSAAMPGPPSECAGTAPNAGDDPPLEAYRFPDNPDDILLGPSTAMSGPPSECAGTAPNAGDDPPLETYRFPRQPGRHTTWRAQ